MQFLGSTLKKHLTYGIYAVALVCSLAIYHQAVVPEPLSVAEKHWAVIASEDISRTTAKYSDRAVLLWLNGVSDQIYRGESIYPAWKDFFSQYQIQKFQIVKQQQNEGAVSAKIAITAKSEQGAVVVMSVAYKVQFDQTGFITQEVWQANPQLSV